MQNSAASNRFGRFLTLADVAEILNVPVSRAQELVGSGELTALRVGHRGEWRVEQSTLEQFIADQYERERRIANFNEAAFVDLPDISGGERWPQ